MKYLVISFSQQNLDIALIYVFFLFFLKEYMLFVVLYFLIILLVKFNPAFLLIHIFQI